MELHRILSLSNSQVALLLRYFIAFNFLLNLQAKNGSTDSNGNMTAVEQCCSNEMPSMNVNKTLFSFTERFILQRTGRNMSIKRLIMNYSSICPLQETCGVGFDKQFLFSFSDELLPSITGCRRCTCNQSCIYHDNCCPGTHYGYVGYKCINTILYPKTTEIPYYMVGSCLENYNENKTIIELCSRTTEPCTGTESGIVYKNKYCGQCNKELDCISWRLKLECNHAKAFEDKVASFSSLRAVKEALDEYKCRIGFKNPDKHNFAICSDSKRVLVDRCNITGLWDIYDSDIDWACKNLIFQYKTFKNVFCYICNPSQANVQTASLIDRCSPARDDTYDLKAEIKKACELFPLSYRFAPYKNVFCYLCNQGYRKLFERSKLFMRDVKENNTVHLQTQLNMTIVFSDVSTFDDVKTLVDDIFSEYFEASERGSNQHEFRKLNYDTPVINGIVKDYIAVCGTKPLCNVNTDTNNTDKVYGNPVCKTCTCDSVCAENENCCPDILFSKEPYSCYKPRMFPSFYKYKSESSKLTQDISSSDILTTDFYQIINICLNEDVAPSKKEKCSVSNGTSNRLSRIPISTESGMTYKNIYCYACNNNKSVITLKFQAICETYIEHKLFTNIDHLLNVIKNYCEIVSFVPVNNKLCLDKYNSKNASFSQGEKFIRRKLHPSQFEFRVQSIKKVNTTDGQKVRNVFDFCNKTGFYVVENTDVIANICLSNEINMLSLPAYRVENNVYKNFACFLCNPEYNLSTMDSHNVTSRCLTNDSVEWYEPNENLEGLCNETEHHERWYPFKNMYCAECNLPPWQLVDVHVGYSHALPAAGYKYIFSLSMADFQHLDEVMETETIPGCRQGIYDYTLKVCRPLSCGNGFQLFNSTCKPVLEFAIRQRYSLSFDLHYLFEERLNISDSSDLNKTVFVNLQTLCSKVADNITSLFGETTEYAITEKECQTSHCSVLSKRKHFVDLIRMDVLRVRLTVLIIKTETVSLVQTALFNALNRQFYITDIQDMHGLPETFYMHSNVNIERNSNKQVFGCIFSEMVRHSKLESQKITSYTIDAFFTCGQVNVNANKVCFNFDANNISLKHSNVTFSVGEYKIVNENVIICADVYNKRTFIEPDAVMVIKTDPIKSSLIVFSFVCTIVSLLCLFLTFITYCFSPSLRTIAGKNIMALCISLFFSQALLQFGINVTKLSTLCVSIGILVHLSWLVSFSAMNVCSFHTFKVFCYNNLSDRSAGNNSDNSLFLKYSLYMICFPVFMVLATISASLIKSSASDIGYGQYYCFISDFHIFLFTFITPACLIFASNIVFFSLAFHKIRSAPNVQGARDRNNFYICLRLCTIVGIAWPLLVIDSSLGITWFSFIVAGVNSLQGVTIFVSFILNRRVALILISCLMEKLGQEALRVDAKSTTRSASRGVKIV